MGNYAMRTVAAICAALGALSLTSCTSPTEEAPSAGLGADTAVWAESVLGSHEGTHLTGTHQGSEPSMGAFHNTDAGWYELRMACADRNGVASGDSMAVAVTADGEPVGDGSVGCSGSAVSSHIQVMAPAENLEVAITNSGVDMVWVVALEPGPPPSS
ncbi:hypothetical protein GC088_12230 [Arthrobacter sp. JZ12]|uniref:hypothetical protein n=1 Tax=Arthrobacter sp. JZ12 TaxID=2654190 RepID=UPI002B46BB1B|nr:hypothetical protein [Arthrobacter sp. JZ12]WRH25759.1 hypothetical protein GC088_12230 [Arthrobacter sp. JZ12]